MTVKRFWSRTEDGGCKPITERSSRRKRRWSRRFVVAVGALCAALFFSCVGFVLALPSVGDARARVAEIVRSHQGEIDGPPLPAKLADAVVAVEDKYFYSNVFMNILYGAARAAFAALRHGGDPGGSTIPQQLAKQLYPHGRELEGTLEEIGLGVKLSFVYSKAEILNMYLNAVCYGNGYWGDAAAARGYFGVAPSQLSWAEATLLAGLPQAPSLYDPFHHFRLAKQRQVHVIDQLVDNAYLTRTQGAAICQEPLRLKSNRGAD